LQGRAKKQDRNILAFTNPRNHVNNDWWGSSLTPSQQYGLDTKLDDGLPYQGRIVDMSGNGDSPNCATANSMDHTTPNATYNVSYTSVGCMMFVDLE
jgi:hypothetical protein